MTIAHAIPDIMSPQQSRAMHVFGAIVVSALALTCIFTAKICDFGHVQAPFELFQQTLLASACIAIPMAGFAVQYELQADTLAQVVPVDAITGLNSPRHLELQISEQSDRRKSADHPDAVMVFEIDGIAQIRQRHGDAAADAVTRWVSDNTMQRLRQPYDKLTRAGEGLFVGVLHSVSIEDAENVCCRLLDQLGDAARQSRFGKITMSFGVAPMIAGQTFAEARKEALIALHDAKRFGRNQVRSRYSDGHFGRYS